MSFITKTIAELSCGFLNSSFCSTSKPNEDDTNYTSPANWGAFLLTVSAGFYLAQVCWKRRTVKQLTLQDCVSDQSKIHQLQKAPNGTCPVYLGGNFVIKEVGDQWRSRSSRTHFANVAIKRQGYSHLIVPKIFGTIGEGKYLAEERLPVLLSTKDAITIYETNRDAFTPAVKEFTNLVLRCQFEDLLALGKGPVPYETPAPRYDNICPYLDENGVGKLGLVDLEHFEENSLGYPMGENFGVKIKNCNKRTCSILIDLFPLHFEKIIKIMQEAGLQLSEEDLQRLRLAQDAQLEQRRSMRAATSSPVERKSE